MAKAKKLTRQKKQSAQAQPSVEYSSNNSGGSWWLEDKHWIALEKAGWIIEWGGSYYCHSSFSFNKPPANAPQPCKSKNVCPGHRRFESHKQMKDADRWLGCLAKKATRYGLSLRDAASEWERVTGMSATDAGCACCGQPHNFTELDADGNHVASGPHAEYVASW